ncbi:hypothetical protein [Azospirillum sp. ST 5-10]|uniref:hypothetical protein n=1 Tax=unclassified Azospirillum TaxID=2630922 RepID=UPI003F49F204
MLHIKDIEAFARINEALAGTGGGPFGGGAEKRGGPLHPAFLFARLATGMMAPRLPGGPTPSPVPAPLPANDADDLIESGVGTALTEATVVAAAANDDHGLPPPAPAESALEIAEDEGGAASVDAIPLACADVVPFRLRPREVADRGADSVGGMAYDFDLVPCRPATMVGMLTRMFFGRR